MIKSVIYYKHLLVEYLTKYTDADRMILENRKAIFKYTFILNSTTISWSSKQQGIVH